MTLVQKVLSGSFWFGLSQIGGIICRFGFLIVLARLLTPAEFGVLGVGIAITGLLEQVMFLCFGQSLVQIAQLDSGHVRSATVILTGIGSVGGAALVWGAWPIAQAYGMPDLTVFLLAFGVALPLISLGAVGRALLVREMRFKRIGLATMLTQLFGYGPIAIFLAMRGAGAIGLIVGTIVQVVALNLYFLHSTHREIRFGWDGPRMKELTRFIAGFASYKIADVLRGNLDSMIIGAVHGAQLVGYYGRAIFLFRVPENTFGGTALRVLFPAFSKIQGETTKLTRSFRRAWTGVLLASVPVIICIMAGGENLIVSLLGESWAPVAALFVMLGLGFILRAGNNVSAAMVNAKGLMFQRAVYMWLIFIFAAIVYALGATQGLIGVGLAFFLVELLNTILITRLALKALESPADWLMRLASRHLITGLTVVLISISVNILITSMVAGPYIPAAMACLTALTLYATISLFLPKILMHDDYDWFLAQLPLPCANLARKFCLKPVSET